MDQYLAKYGLGALTTVIGLGLAAVPKRLAHIGGACCIAVGLGLIVYVVAFPKAEPATRDQTAVPAATVATPSPTGSGNRVEGVTIQNDRPGEVGISTSGNAQLTIGGNATVCGKGGGVAARDDSKATITENARVYTCDSAAKKPSP